MNFPRPFTRAASASALVLVLVLAIAAGCARSSEPAPAPERVEVLAPIESAEIVVRESFPPQYTVQVVSGLPSGCARFERIDVERAGGTIDVTVWNTMPADRATPCTMIYGTAQHSVRLDGEFTSGETYVVNVNEDERLTFVAQ